MGDDFLIIREPVRVIRNIYLKLKILEDLKKFSDSKTDLIKDLKENTKLNNILDKKGNDIKEINSEEDSSHYDMKEPETLYIKNIGDIIIPKEQTKDYVINLVKKLEYNQDLIKKELKILPNKNETDSECTMIEIELHDLEDTKLDDEDKKYNNKCVSGCNLIVSVIGYVCECIGYYFMKMLNGINNFLNNKSKETLNN